MKEEEDLQIWSKKFLSFFDFFPVLVCKEKLSVRSKIIHTFIGLFLMVAYQLCPFFLIYFIERSFSRNFLNTSNRNFVSISRNALLISPILFNILTRIFNLNYKTQYQKEICTRSLRNLSVIISSLIRNVGILYYRELKVEALLLVPYELRWINFVLVFYAFQCLITSIATLIIEEYLTQMSLFGEHIVIYYQITDLLIQISSNPLPVSFGFGMFLKLFFITYILVLIDRVYSTEIITVHSQVSSIKGNVSLIISSNISTVITIQNLLKSTLWNFIDLGLNPVYNYFTNEILVSDYWLESPFFNNNYYLIWYVPWFSSEWYNLLFYNFIDNVLLFSFLCWKIDWFSVELDPVYLHNSLLKNRYRVKDSRSSNDQYNMLKKQYGVLKTKVIIIGLIVQSILPSINFYGLIIRGDLFYYYYGRINSVIESLLKLKKDDVPLSLRTLRDRLILSRSK